MKITNDEGLEIDVYTADEAKALADAAVKTKEEEFGKTKSQIEAELTEAKKALGERTGEFKTFRKLNEDTIAKLSVAERTIYDNQRLMDEERIKREGAEKLAREKQIESAIRAKVGKDDKLFGKVKDMYSIIGIEANTPEEIDRKTLAALGALQTTEPDLVAAALGASGGSFVPPGEQKKEDKSFADTDKGRAMANELGLKLEADKK